MKWSRMSYSFPSYIQSTPAIPDDQNLEVFRPLQRGSGIEKNTRVIEVSDGNTGVETISRLGNIVVYRAGQCQYQHYIGMKTTKEKLSDFEKHFLDDQGLTVPISTLSGILEKKNMLLDFCFSSTANSTISYAGDVFGGVGWSGKLCRWLDFAPGTPDTSVIP